MVVNAPWTQPMHLKQSAIVFKATWSFVAFYFYCKIMLYGVNYTYYSVTPVKICFHLPFRGLTILGVENRRSKGYLTHRPRGVFETVVGVAKSPEGNA